MPWQIISLRGTGVDARIRTSYAGNRIRGHGPILAHGYFVYVPKGLLVTFRGVCPMCPSVLSSTVTETYLVFIYQEKSVVCHCKRTTGFSDALKTLRLIVAWTFAATTFVTWSWQIFPSYFHQWCSLMPTKVNYNIVSCLDPSFFG